MRPQDTAKPVHTGFRVKFQRGRREDCFKGLSPGFFAEGFVKMVETWDKCLSYDGTYVEK